MRKLQFEEMRVAELARAKEEAPLAYVPIGSIEYHGFHLPTGLDAMHAHALCLAAAAETGGVVLPPTYWGTRGHEGFPGSLLLKSETIAALMRDVLEQLSAQGYRLIVVCTGHYPEVQGRLLKEVAAQHMTASPGVRVIVADPFTVHPTDQRSEHAGRKETSAMLHLRPDLVDMAQLEQPGALHAISVDCVEATPEYGAERFAGSTEGLVRVVREALAEVAAP